jgi:hypothetical protein
MDNCVDYSGAGIALFARLKRVILRMQLHAWLSLFEKISVFPCLISRLPCFYTKIPNIAIPSYHEMA